MSKDSSKVAASKSVAAEPWNPWLGVLMAAVIFLGAQLASGLILSLYPLINGWSSARAELWFNDSLAAKIGSFMLYGLLVFAGLRLFLGSYKAGFDNIGLKKPRWKDGLYSLIAFPVYLGLLMGSVLIAQIFVPDLNLNQQQELGFNGTYGALELLLIGLTLVVMTPIIEELIFRGLLYGSLKKGTSILVAAFITSALFAAGHLSESSSGPLYIAGIDTFVLSAVLIYLREKTGSLWASIGLHALKNAIAFVTVFVLKAS